MRFVIESVSVNASPVDSARSPKPTPSFRYCNARRHRCAGLFGPDRRRIMSSERRQEIDRDVVDMSLRISLHRRADNKVVEAV